MRVFVSGATGVVGRRAVRDLVEQGHEVTALVRTDDKARLVEALGARPARVSLFDQAGLEQAIAGHDVVVNLATSIPPVARTLSKKAWAGNDRIRTEGSRILVDAALAAGAGRYVQESITFLYADGGESWIDEDSPVETTPVAASAVDAEANAARFTAAGRVGIVLRFGAFYGPDSGHTVAMLRLAKMGLDAMPGEDGDYVSFIATDDAATAVVAALGAPAGVYNIVDDRPLTRTDFDRILAAAVGVRRVHRPAAFRALARKAMGHLTRSHRVSNRHFRGATGWAPRYACVADGVPDTIAASPVAKLPAGARRTRILLGLLAVGALLVGAWAEFAPHSFYHSFPGAGRSWVSVDGPFNEHLVRDVGGLNLALALLTIAAAISLGRGLVRAAGGAWLVYGLPHLAYHAAHLTLLPPADRLANVALLGGVVVVALLLLRGAPDGDRFAVALARPAVHLGPSAEARLAAADREPGAQPTRGQGAA